MPQELLVEASVHNFAAQMCNAMGMFAYVVVGTITENRQVQAYGGWAGTLPEGVSSLAPHVAHVMMGELVMVDGGLNLNDKLVMTPTDTNNEFSCGWMGAVAQNGLIVAVSRWDWKQEYDRLLALMVLYNRLHNPLQLHHVGFRFPNSTAYENGNKSFHGGIERNIPGDHDRTYFPMAGNHYREHQWFPNGPYDNARHWDFVVSAPEEFLKFIAHAYGQEPVLFDSAGENDPIGLVWITDASHGLKMGVMARRQWWNVDEG